MPIKNYIEKITIRAGLPADTHPNLVSAAIESYLELQKAGYGKTGDMTGFEKSGSCPRFSRIGDTVSYCLDHKLTAPQVAAIWTAYELENAEALKQGGLDFGPFAPGSNRNWRRGDDSAPQETF
jgi:hypothetical protein